jgi:hypothetical protein
MSVFNDYIPTENFQGLKYFMHTFDKTKGSMIIQFILIIYLLIYRTERRNA